MERLRAGSPAFTFSSTEEEGTDQTPDSLHASRRKSEQAKPDLPMSDTTEAAVRLLRETSPTIDAVCRQLERQVDPDEAELVSAFAEIFFSRARPELLHARSSDALAHMALGAFRFLQQSRPDRVDVQVINPDIDNEGWYAPVTVLRTNISERPFIVDTIREFLHSQDLAIEHIIYPVLHVERAEDGTVVAVRPSRDGERRESLVHCEVPRVTDQGTLDFLHDQVAERLQDVVRATDDFHPMVDAVNNTVAELAERAQDLADRREEIREVQEFLRWLRDGAFVFLGYRGYDIVGEGDERAIVVEPGSGLGVLRNEAESQFAEPVPLSSMDPSLRQLVEGGPLLIISKTNATSTVHRMARMDYIGVKKLDRDGNVVGEHRFIGLFTSKAYAEPAESIPILRRKLQQILESAGVGEGSHDYKEIYTIFNSLPKQELFLTSAEEIAADVQLVLTSYNTEGVRATVREDPLHRGVSLMVILPREKFSGEVRKAIEEALVRRFHAEVLNYHLALGEGDQARLHFYLAVDPQRKELLQASEVEAVVRELTRSWADEVQRGLDRVRPPDEARRLARSYNEAVSAEYRAATRPEVAVLDILELEAMAADGRSVAISFATSEPGAGALAEGETATVLKLYLRGERLILSDFMPILENAGLRVIAVSPFEIGARDGSPDAVIYSFLVQDSHGRPLEIDETGTLLSQTILAVRAGDVTNDALNALVLEAGLAWREVDVLRAYASYAFQLGLVPSRLALPNALRAYPNIARVLFDLFRAKFDPEGPASDERERAVAEIRRFLDELLGGVTSLADDRALRRLILLVEATVRTNYYRNGGRSPTRRSGGVPYVSFKFACKKLREVVRTRLLYEVWVRSSRMEGVHLRGAKVARGGIRWSDRPDDFRTEILGLVNTQMVKNAVIVPAGSKGGFVPFRNFEDREAWAEEGKEQYRTLVRGLLDLTDNLDEKGEIVPPEGVVCWDDPDPYLVVAADKGTAKFSDVANAISEEYGFWLGDAFASGGSHGYDHKVVGITARGAWECVKRHFREIGKDIQNEPFTVVGIGDMSGDVFGNGMLLSRKIRLIAAFDHRHIFIDPDPDPERSWEERKRLFDLGRSSWEDYDTSLLSPGGMIVPRGSKSVELSAEARKALGLDEDPGPLDGEALIRAVLRAPVELLWNGGIGTYVKASTETHSDAGDASNDAVRVDATELRCTVVGEGGNLGFTQRARIEFALRGGRLNTDALDNSGGVDLSDREVNLKILLNHPVRAGRMSQDERNTLLEELTDDVARLVLRDNESQSRAVSLDALRARKNLDDFRDFMSALEKKGRLDRQAETLPTWEALEERLEEHGTGLTRPELSVLLAYAKLDLMASLLQSDLPDDEAARDYLVRYFPERALEAAGADALGLHRLRREIVASQLTNEVVDLMGATFVYRVARDTGRSPAEVVRAWLAGARFAEHHELVRRLSEAETAMQIPSKAAYRWFRGFASVLERTARWVLDNVASDRDVAELLRDHREALGELRRSFGEFVQGEERDAFESRVEEIEQLGVDPDFARALISLRFLDQLLEILSLSKESGVAPLAVGRAYYHVSERFRVPWLRQLVFEAAGDDRWEQRAAQALANEINRAHHRIVAGVLSRIAAGGEVAGATEALLAEAEQELSRFRSLLAEVEAEAGTISLAGLSVAVREMALLADRLTAAAA
ncbi:MAG: NAD-glutamate dehydrogenase [Gemmatimonadetes bacterium]|nr:MAG: NAD-glutamate dehydrogenase [Gemmatimonadota bacterium]